MRTAVIIAGLMLIWQAFAGRADAQQGDELRLEDMHEVELATKIPPRLSPDGKWIACIRRNEDRSFTYYLVRTEGKMELRLHDLPLETQSDMAMLFMASGIWSPDGKKFLAAVPERDVEKIGDAAGIYEHRLSLAICDVSGMIDGKKTEPAMTRIARAVGVPYGGVFGNDGKVYWSSVVGLGDMKTATEIRVFNPADGKDKKFLVLPDFGLIYLSASPDRTMLGGLTLAHGTQRTDEEDMPSGGYERRLWVCRLADAAAAFTGPRTITRSKIVDGRCTFWSEDGKFFYAVSSDRDGGRPTGLFAFEPFQNRVALTEQQTARIKLLIDQLGAKELSKREEAHAELLKDLGMAKKFLEGAVQNPDPEIAARAKIILQRSGDNVKKVAPEHTYEAAGLLAPGIISAVSPEGAAVFIDAEKDAPVKLGNTEAICLVDRQGRTGLFVNQSGQFFIARINFVKAPASQPATMPASKRAPA
ncbi:MAG: hypothetical protein HZA50_09540 [Planctomycetes bacterium]|nr:hypothetical protein [Planctomycetota bacterium]